MRWPTATEQKVKLALAQAQLAAALKKMELEIQQAMLGRLKEETMTTTTNKMIEEMNAVEAQLRPMRAKRAPDKNKLLPIWEGQNLRTRYFHAGPIGNNRRAYWCVAEKPNIAGYILLWYEVREPGKSIKRTRYSASKNFYTMLKLAQQRADATYEKRQAAFLARREKRESKERIARNKRIAKKKGLSRELKAMTLSIEKNPDKALLPRYNYRADIIPFLVEAIDSHNVKAFMRYVGRMGMGFEDAVISALPRGGLSEMAAHYANERRSKAAGEWVKGADIPADQPVRGPMDYAQIWKE